MGFRLTDHAWGMTLGTTTELPFIRAHRSDYSGDTHHWSISFLWRYGTGSGTRHFLREGIAGNELDISYIYSSNSFRFRFTADSGVRNAVLAMPSAFTPGELVLLTISFQKRSVGVPVVRVMARSQSVNPTHTDAPVNVNGGEIDVPGSAQLGIGDPIGNTDGVTGDILGIAVARQANPGDGSGYVGWDEFDEMWAAVTTRPDAILNYPRTKSGSDIAPEASSVWLGFAHNKFCFGLYELTVANANNYIGATFATGAHTVFLQGSNIDRSETVTVTAGSPTIVSPYDSMPDLWDKVRPARSAGNGSNSIRYMSVPIVRQFAAASFSGVIRTMFSCNSRTAGRGLQEGWERNHHMACVRDRIGQTVGMMMQPPYTANRERFGFQGVVYTAGGAALAGDSTTWTRVGSGGWTATITGEGKPLLIPPGGVYAARIPEDEGGMAGADPLQVDAVFLKLPAIAGSTMAYEAAANKHDNDVSNVGTDDGTPVTGSFASDAIFTIENHADWAGSSTTGILLNNDHTGDVSPGDLCLVNFGSGYEINSVADVAFNTGVTAISFKWAFSDTPASDDAFHFCPFELGTVRVTNAAVSGGNTRRGIRLENDASTTTGIPWVILGLSPLNTAATEGQVIGHTGKAGDGYDEQLDVNATGLFREIARVTSPDIWLQYHAQQSSGKESMTEFAAEVAAGSPDTHIVWIAEAFHGGAADGEDQESAGTTTQDAWNVYTRLEAPGISVDISEDPDVGDFWAQVLDGLREDDAHYTARGHLRLWQVLEPLLIRAARALLPRSGRPSGMFNRRLAMLGGRRP